MSTTDGDRDVTLSFTLEVIVGMTVFDDLRKNRNIKDELSWWKITREDSDSNALVWTQLLRGRVTQFNITDREEGTSQVAVTIRVFEVVTNAIA